MANRRRSISYPLVDRVSRAADIRRSASLIRPSDYRGRAGQLWEINSRIVDADGAPIRYVRNRFRLK